MKIKTPSKELLSEVLDENVTSVDEIKEINLTFTSFDNMWSGEYAKHKINIYELAHKCKEWAFSKGYMIDSRLEAFLPEYNNGVIGIAWISNMKVGTIKKEQSDTEQEAIFTACQWILDNKNKKD